MLMHDKIEEFLNDEPWWVVDESKAEFLNKELKKELSPNHLLYGKKAVAVASRFDCDDVVYWISELEKYAVVHLTWSKETSSQFPNTKLFTLSELEEHCKNVSKFY